MGYVLLKSSDNQTFKIDKKTAKLSAMIKKTLETPEFKRSDEDIPFSLSHSDGNTLKKVVEYLEYHKDDEEDPPSLSPDADDFAFEKPTDDIIPFDVDLMEELTDEELTDLVSAAEKLMIPPLIELTCKTIAIRINGKGMEDIRQMLGITETMDNVRQNQLMQENIWLEKCEKIFHE